MIRRLSSRLAAPLFVLAVTACATQQAPAPSATEIRQGVIEQISAVQLTSPDHAGVGAVVGGVAGLGIGSLFGGGSGRDVAMVLGAVGGAVAGNEAQKNYDQPVPGQQIIVRTRNGVLVSVTQPVNPALGGPGQLVYVQGNGQSARVVPQY